MSITTTFDVSKASPLTRDARSSCETCAFAAEHHRWPMAAGTHCRGCHRSWVSTAQAHCTVCHQSFAGNSVADLHWLEPKGQLPVHLDPSTITRLESHQEAMGAVWRSTGDREPRSFLLYAERRAFSATECFDGVQSALERSRPAVGAVS